MSVYTTLHPVTLLLADMMHPINQHSGAPQSPNLRGPHIRSRHLAWGTGVSLGPQMSMHTTLDLVLLLLDDIDAGRDIDPLRTEQLRVALLSTDGAQLDFLPADLVSICHRLMPISSPSVWRWF